MGEGGHEEWAVDKGEERKVAGIAAEKNEQDK